MRQFEAITSALEVARRAPHGAAKTHFTIFPEYGIPAPEGLELVDQALRQPDWPNQTIVIGGTDGLNKKQYSDLVTQCRSHVNPSNEVACVSDGQWVNCGIVWVKDNRGEVSRWLQPKLHPSWGEEDVPNSQMFMGKSVFVFSGSHDNGTPYRFGVLVCFDWVADISGRRPWREILRALSKQAVGLGVNLPISWLFVIQHNRSPSHHSFMNEVNDFFDHRFAANIRRDRACLIFANSAGRDSPGSIQKFGRTSLIFSDQTRFELPTCPNTFCTDSYRLRGHKLVDHHKDLVFREGGACVHSFEQTNPDQVGPGPSERKGPLKNPFVHAVGECTDPRVPGGAVPASVKWMNDELDAMESIPRAHTREPLAGELTGARERKRADLGRMQGEAAERTLRLASPKAGWRDDVDGKSESITADHWDAPERLAVGNMLDTLSILSVCSDDCSVPEATTHATMSVSGRTFDVVAVYGETHEDCREHCTATCPSGRYPVLLVSRDRENDEWFSRFGRFVEPQPDGPHAERDFTDPDRGVVHLGFRDVFQMFRGSGSVQDAKEKLSAKLCV